MKKLQKILKNYRHLSVIICNDCFLLWHEQDDCIIERFERKKDLFNYCKNQLK